MTETINAFLALYGAPITLLLQLPEWQGHLAVGLLLAGKLGLGGWVLARAGRSPLWVFALLVPYLDLLALWIFAWSHWPAMAIGGAGTESATANPERADSRNT
ncbi:MAG: hypothetical protein GC191_19390 [Azospirillum sp.]|nr:hypothetical protein [Azospirillum sp.]